MSRWRGSPYLKDKQRINNFLNNVIVPTEKTNPFMQECVSFCFTPAEALYVYCIAIRMYVYDSDPKQSLKMPSRI